MTHPLEIKDAAAARAFMLGGSASFTLVSKRTGTRYTYRVKRAKDELGNHTGGGMFFVQLLTGPDNTADYEYLGFTRGFEMVAGRKGNPNHPAYRAVDWTIKNLANKNMPGELEFWHEGRCARCAKILTDPVSIERGLGPECAGKD